MSINELLRKLDLERPVGPQHRLEEYLNRFGRDTNELQSVLSDLEDADSSQLFAPVNAYKLVDFLTDFFKERSDEEFALLCHAALPASLTPDLFQTLRASLPFNGLSPQWEDAVRLLLSEYFRPVAHQTYEMDLNTRRAFVKCLELCYGPQRLEDIAHLLLAYYKDILDKPNSPGHSLAKAQQITAYAYLDPAIAVQELSLSYSAISGQENSPERMRLAALVASLSEQLADHKELIQYAESWRAQIHQDTASLRSSLAPLMKGGQATTDALVLPVPKDMYFALKEEFNNEDPLWEAKKRIREAEERNEHTLNLSGLGLHELPDELLDLRGVDELDLSDNRFTVLPELLSQMDWLQTLRLNNNGLRVIGEELVRLQQLEYLEVKDNLLRRLPEGLGQINRLNEIHLENNQFASLPYWILDGSYQLFAQGNPLPDIDLSDDPSEQIDISQQTQQSTPDYGQRISDSPSEIPGFPGSPGSFADSEQYAIELAKYQQGLEQGPQRIVQLLLWENPFERLTGFFNRLSRGQGRNGRLNSVPNEIMSQYEYAFGVDFGLPADVLVHVDRFGHSTDEIGIQAYCSSNSIVVFSLEDISELERWVMRLPTGRKLTGVICVSDPSALYLLEIQEVVMKRYPKTFSELIAIDPDTDLGGELLLDLVQKASEERAIPGPGRAGYEDLIRVLDNDQPIHEKELENIAIPPHRFDLSFQNSGQGIADALESAEYLSKIKGLNTNGTYYFSPAGLRNIFLNTQAAMNHFYWMGFNDIRNAAERYFSSPDMGTYLSEEFLGLGWLTQLQNSESDYFSYSALTEAERTYNQEDFPFPANAFFCIRFDHIPYALKDSVYIIADSPEKSKGSGISLHPNTQFMVPLPGGKSVWRFQLEKDLLFIRFDNATPDEKSVLSDDILAFLDKALERILDPGVMDIWISRLNPQDDQGTEETATVTLPTQPSENKDWLHYPTLNNIFKLGKQSFIIQDKLEWHSIRYALGIANSISHAPQMSTRKTMLLYAREDFEVATKIIEASGRVDTIGEEPIRLLPYTPDLYAAHEHPTFREMLEEMENVILVFTENFVTSPASYGLSKWIVPGKRKHFLMMGPIWRMNRITWFRKR